MILNPPIEADIRKMYADWRKDPNLLSFWFPKVRDCGFRVPETDIIPVPDDILHSLFLEEEGDLARVEGFIRDTIMPRIKDMEARTGGRIPFLKNGCFSGKFDFQTCAPRDDRPETILKSFLTINQDAIAFGAMGATEFVIREKIRQNPSIPRIYGGMPLSTEFRVFYDFTTRRPLYCANYWDEGYCRDAIGRHPKDLREYDRRLPALEKTYREQAPMAFELVRKTFSNVEGLKDVWSVDLLLDSDGGWWLIDMAQAHRSVYWDPGRALLLSFEEEYWAYLRSLPGNKEATDAMQLARSAGALRTRPGDTVSLWKTSRLPFFLEKTGLDLDELIGRYFPEESREKEHDIHTGMIAVRMFLHKELYSAEGIIRYLRSREADFDEVETCGDLCSDPDATIRISITWGDWKHSHRYLDYLMGLRGFTDFGEKITEENGDDTYSSVHTFDRSF